MREFLQIVYEFSVVGFVVASMVAMGLDLTVRQIVKPLKNPGLVSLVLAANFLAVPFFAYLLVQLLPLSMGVKEGIILLSVAAGAPFLPKLACIAKSDPAMSIALMLLLMVATVFFMPLVLPRLIEGTVVDAAQIARSLVTLMLLPLVVALFVRARYENLANRLYPSFVSISDVALAALAVSLVILHTKSILGLWGWGLVSIILLLGGAMAIGYLFGYGDSERRFMLSIATAQRNISAAILVAAKNFDDPEVMLTMVAAAILGLLIMLPYARARGKCAVDLKIS
ncbi:bile acid:sodium symporter family protein [Hydrogenimonas sp.]